MNTPRIDRGDAVNLASNLISRRDTGSYRDGVTDKGMKTLLDSVLLMDEGIRQLETELAAAQERIKALDKKVKDALADEFDKEADGYVKTGFEPDHYVVAVRRQLAAKMRHGLYDAAIDASIAKEADRG